MFKQKEELTEQVQKSAVEPEKLALEDLEHVTGGAGLRNAQKTKTTEISEDTKFKI